MSSSTSSSDAGSRVGGRRTIRRISWGLVVMIALLAAAELFVFRNVFTYDMGRAARGGFVGQWAHLERSLAATDAAAIEYAIFGDSQSIDALRPELMAAELGVAADRIFNFSVSGGKPTDMLYTYKRYKDKLPNLREAIVVVNEHQFNNADVAADSKFKFHAGLLDRLRVMSADNYGELLGGWALRSFGMRSEWTRLISMHREGRWPSEPAAAYPGGIEPLTWSPPEHRTAGHAAETAERWFDGWQPEGRYTSAYMELLARLHADGVRTVVVQVPRSSLFDGAVQADYVRQRGQYEELVTWGVQRYDGGVIMLDADMLNMTIEHFRDTNHVNAAGAEIVSRYVAQKLWE